MEYSIEDFSVSKNGECKLMDVMYSIVRYYNKKMNIECKIKEISLCGWNLISTIRKNMVSFRTGFNQVRVTHLFSFTCCVFACFSLFGVICPVLPVSLYSPFLIAALVFSNVYFPHWRSCFQAVFTNGSQKTLEQ